MKLISIFGLTGLVAVSLAQTVDSSQNFGSLFPQGHSENVLLSRTARVRGDLVTILVSENSTASFSATTQTSKKDSTSVPRPTLPLVDFLGGSALSKVLGGGASSSANSSVAGAGSTTQSGQFTARLTVVIKDVLPNGNMVVEGTRFVTVNKELQSVILTGIIRRDDVRSDNTILSENVANAEIKAEGKGAVADKQRRGFISRILDWLF